MDMAAEASMNAPSVPNVPSRIPSAPYRATGICWTNIAAKPRPTADRMAQFSQNEVLL